MASDITYQSQTQPDVDEDRRDFIVLAASATAAMGGAVSLWPFIDSMNPAADSLALATIEVDVSSIEVGQQVKVTWRGKPVFIRRRTSEEVAEAKAVDINDLPHQETDESRTIEGKEEWMVIVGVCTHLGCIPLGINESGYKGEYGGWFCPCHGSHYDTSGRIRKGPAPDNLVVPTFTFINDDVILIG